MKDKLKRCPQEQILMLSISSMNRTNRENPIKLEKYSQKVSSVPTSICIYSGSISNPFIFLAQTTESQNIDRSVQFISFHKRSATSPNGLNPAANKNIPNEV